MNNKRIYPHAHKSIELLHCIEGSGNVTLDDETLSFRKGETAVRCDNARHLLKENIPISKISYECGFENCSLFAKEFKRHFQLLPSEYRKIKQKRT